MSVVSGIMILCSVSDHDKLTAINAWVDSLEGGMHSHRSPMFKDTSDGAGGTKHPQFSAFAAGINYGQDIAEGLPAFLATLDWMFPENVVMVVQPEDGATDVWRPAYQLSGTPMTDHPSPADMTDAELVATWQESGGETGDPWVEALAAEMARRDVDF